MESQPSCANVHAQPGLAATSPTDGGFFCIGPSLVLSHDSQYRITASWTGQGDIVAECIASNLLLVIIHAAKICDGCHREHYCKVSIRYWASRMMESMNEDNNKERLA
jgi:hypothetical protein